MLPLNHRLFYKDTAVVKSRGKRISSGFLELSYILKGAPPSRWVVLIPKTKIKKATDRNRERRLIHEDLRLNIAEHTLPHDGVLWVRGPAKPADMPKTHVELQNLFFKAGLIK